jgi:hypothetical protein
VFHYGKISRIHIGDQCAAYQGYQHVWLNPKYKKSQVAQKKKKICSRIFIPLK